MNVVGRFFVRAAFRGIGAALRGTPGLGAVAAVYAGGGTIEQILAAFTTVSASAKDDEVISAIDRVVGMVTKEPLCVTLDALGFGGLTAHEVVTEILEAATG